MDCSIILDQLTTNVKNYRDMIDGMLEKTTSQTGEAILKSSRQAYVNVLDEISTLKTAMIVNGIDNCQNELKQLQGE